MQYEQMKWASNNSNKMWKKEKIRMSIQQLQGKYMLNVESQPKMGQLSPLNEKKEKTMLMIQLNIRTSDVYPVLMIQLNIHTSDV